MEEKDFDKGLRQLVLSHAEKSLAHIGDMVTTLWGDWKKEHKVMIYEVGVALVSLKGNRARRDNESVEDYEREVLYMGVEHYYYALRLNKNGVPKEKYGIALTNFKTLLGKHWEKKHRDFNHVGLSFMIERIPEQGRV